MHAKIALNILLHLILFKVGSIYIICVSFYIMCIFMFFLCILVLCNLVPECDICHCTASLILCVLLIYYLAQIYAIAKIWDCFSILHWYYLRWRIYNCILVLLVCVAHLCDLTCLIVSLFSYLPIGMHVNAFNLCSQCC